MKKQPLEVKQEDIDTMLEILNVERNEDTIAMVTKMLIKSDKETKGYKMDHMETTREYELEQLADEYGVNIFDEKIKELKDNIIKPAYTL